MKPSSPFLGIFSGQAAAKVTLLQACSIERKVRLYFRAVMRPRFPAVSIVIRCNCLLLSDVIACTDNSYNCAKSNTEFLLDHPWIFVCVSITYFILIQIPGWDQLSWPISVQLLTKEWNGFGCFSWRTMTLN